MNCNFKLRRIDNNIVTPKGGFPIVIVKSNVQKENKQIKKGSIVNNNTNLETLLQNRKTKMDFFTIQPQT